MSNHTSARSTASRAKWRPLTLDDIPQLMTIANTIHKDLPEDASVFAERITLFPAGCRALVAPQEQQEEDGGTGGDGGGGAVAVTARTSSSRLCGYLISHPIRAGRPPSLGALLGNIPDSESGSDEGNELQYYIHDLALMPETRGHGHAAEVIESLFTTAAVDADDKGVPRAPAREYKTTALISVYGTAPFWHRMGFKEKPLDGAEDAELARKLRGYGSDATYMVRQNRQ